MLRALKNWFGGKRARTVASRRSAQRRVRLGIETLEDRTVPTIVINPNFGPETLVKTPNNDYNFQTLSSPTVYVIFWGSYWTANQSQATTLGQEAKAILASPYLRGLTQYGSNGKAVLGGEWIDGSSNPLACFGAGNTGSSGAVQNKIVQAINNPRNLTAINGSAKNIPAPANNGSLTTSPIYVVVTDPNFANSAGGYNVPASYTPTHTPINMISVGMGATASMPDPMVHFGQVFSHEMVERMSDPTRNNWGVSFQTPAGSNPNVVGMYRPGPTFRLATTNPTAVGMCFNSVGQAAHGSNPTGPPMTRRSSSPTGLSRSSR